MSEAVFSGKPAAMAGGAARHPLVAFTRRLIREKPLGAAGGLVFLLFLVAGVLAEVIAPYGANETNMLRRLEAPSLEFWLGTDDSPNVLQVAAIFGVP